MDLLNNRVYPTRDIERWLSDRAGVAPGTRAWKRALRDASEVVVDADTYFFEAVSETHYRVHRADAQSVKEIHAILRDATRKWMMRHVVRVVMVLIVMLAVAAAAVIFGTRG
jgi:hypothetical protein